MSLHHRPDILVVEIDLSTFFRCIIYLCRYCYGEIATIARSKKYESYINEYFEDIKNWILKIETATLIQYICYEQLGIMYNKKN